MSVCSRSTLRELPVSCRPLCRWYLCRGRESSVREADAGVKWTRMTVRYDWLTSSITHTSASLFLQRLEIRLGKMQRATAVHGHSVPRNTLFQQSLRKSTIKHQLMDRCLLLLRICGVFVYSNIFTKLLLRTKSWWRFISASVLSLHILVEIIIFGNNLD